MNVGATGWLTVTLIVAVVAQVPAVGVKVYVVVVVLFTAGDHVPFIPFNEAVGSVNDPPLQIGATCVNVGTSEFTTNVTVVVWLIVPATPVMLMLYVPCAKAFILFNITL